MPSDYKEEDQEIREAYEEYKEYREQQTKTTPKSIISKIPRNIIIAIFGIVAFLMYLTFVTKVLEPHTLFWFVIGLGILIMILGAQQEVHQKHMIPENQLKAILLTKLKEKQRISPTEVPNGDISILLACKLKKIEGNPIKYVMSFKITSPSGLEKYYTAEMNPYDGYLMGFEERPAGFRGTEVTDIKFIQRKEDKWRQEYPHIYKK